MPQDLNVDLEQLRDTGQAVKLDVDNGLRPGLSDTDQKIHQGVPFGSRSPSGEAEAARLALTYALNRYARNNTSHLERAEQISAFLGQIVAEYGNADALSALRLEDVLELLDSAKPVPPSPTPVAGDQP